MRSSASLAIGALPSLAMSKNLRRRCAQQKASVIASSPAASAIVLVGRISVALHDAAIAIEQLERVDRAATGSVAVGDRRRIGPAPGPVVAGDGPEVSLLGAAAAGIEHRRHRLVDRDLAGGQNELAQPKIERLELGGRIAHPERQDRALDVEALGEQHLGLPIERQMPGVFGDQHDRRPSPRSAARP